MSFGRHEARHGQEHLAVALALVEELHDALAQLPTAGSSTALGIASRLADEEEVEWELRAHVDRAPQALQGLLSLCELTSHRGRCPG